MGENIENIMLSVVLRRSLVRSVRLLQERRPHTAQDVSIFESFKKSQPTQFSFDLPRSCSTMPAFSDVNYDQLVEILKNNKATVIDVRNPEELKDYGAIPGAVNIPLKKLKETLSDNAEIPLSRPLVFSCQAGIRSKKAVVIASSCGYKNLLDYSGGWLDWAGHQSNN